MKSSGERNFESATIPNLNALFQTALQLTEDRATAEELVTDVCSYAWKSFGRRYRLADWRSTLFKILIERGAVLVTAPNVVERFYRGFPALNERSSFWWIARAFLTNKRRTSWAFRGKWWRTESYSGGHISRLRFGTIVRYVNNRINRLDYDSPGQRRPDFSASRRKEP